MENKDVFIVDDCMQGLQTINESEITTFSPDNKYGDKFKPLHGGKITYLGGVFTELGVRNRNERVYTYENFNPFVQIINEQISNGEVIWGEFDHPDIFNTSLKNVSHIVTKLTINEERNTVNGVLRILSGMPNGKAAYSIIQEGLPLYVSSRAAGTTTPDGAVSLKELFTYDMVGKPGFAKAKVETLNESLGFKNNSSFRIYDFSNTLKINDFIMNEKNGNEKIAENDAKQYLNHLTNEIDMLKECIKNMVAKNNVDDTKKIIEMSERIENQQQIIENLQEFLNFLSQKTQIVVNENKNFRKLFDTLAVHQDSIVDYVKEAKSDADKTKSIVNETVEFVDELKEKVIINEKYMVNELAQKLDMTIQFVENVSENASSTRNYVVYLAKNQDKLIGHNNYIIEKMEVNKKYMDYLTKYADAAICMLEENANHLNNTIGFVEYTAKETQTTQAYTQYQTELIDNIYEALKSSNLNESIDLSKLQAIKENFDTSKYYQMVSEDEEFTQFNTNVPVEKISTQTDIQIQDEDGEDKQNQIQIQDENVEVVDNVQTQDNDDKDDNKDNDSVQMIDTTQTVENDNEIKKGDSVKVQIGDETLLGTVAANIADKNLILVDLQNGETQEYNEAQVSKFDIKNDYKLFTESLIKNAKKQKAEQDFVPEFVSRLSESKKQMWFKLLKEDRDKVVFAVNESKAILYSENDILNFINNTLTVKKDLTEVLLENMPSELKPVWDKINENDKNKILFTAQAFPNVVNNPSVKVLENFWITRNLGSYLITEKVLINESKQTFETSDDVADKFMNNYNKLTGNY